MTVGCSFGVNTRYTVGVVEVETESNSILKPVQEIDDEMNKENKDEMDNEEKGDTIVALAN